MVNNPPSFRTDVSHTGIVPGTQQQEKDSQEKPVEALVETQSGYLKQTDVSGNNIVSPHHTPETVKVDEVAQKKISETPKKDEIGKSKTPRKFSTGRSARVTGRVNTTVAGRLGEEVRGRTKEKVEKGSQPNDHVDDISLTRVPRSRSPSPERSDSDITTRSPSLERGDSDITSSADTDPSTKNGELDALSEDKDLSLGAQPPTNSGNLPTSNPVIPPDLDVSSDEDLSGTLSPPNSPGVQVVVQQQNNPSNPIDPMQAIRDLAKNAPSSKQSSQEILGDMINKLKDQGYNTNIKVNSELATNTKKFEVEPFQVSGETFYRVKVTYEVVAEKPGTPPTQEKLSFSRTISTSGTNPEDAILIATEFKDTVCGYALKIGKEPHPFDKVSNDFEDFAKSSKTFSFQFAKNAAGNISHLKSISVSNNKDKTSITHTVDSNDQPKYVYNYKRHSYEETQSQEEEINPGLQFFGNQSLKLIHERGISVKNEDFSQELLKRGDALVQHGARLYEEIQKKSEEFARIKADFIKEPSYSLFNKLFRKKAQPEPGVTEAFNHFKANAHAFHKLTQLGEYDPVNLADLKDASSEIQKYADIKNNIIELRNKRKTIDDHAKEFEALMEKIEEDPDIIESLGFDDAQDFWEKVENYIPHDDPRLADKEIPEIIAECLKAIEDEAKATTGLIVARRKELKALEVKIKQTQGSFNEQLKEMSQVNRDLAVKIAELKDLQTKAEDIVGNAGYTDQAKKAEAQKLVDLISKDTIKELEEQYGKPQKVIDIILTSLGEFDSGIATATEDTGDTEVTEDVEDIED